MDKSRVCVNQAKQLAKQRACVKKTNILVYDKSKPNCNIDVKPGGYIIPPIANVPAKKIRVCTGADLRKMCAPKLCECPKVHKVGLMTRLFRLIGFGIKLVIAGGLIYWTYDMGLWGDSYQSEEIYLGLCETITPLICSCPPKPRNISDVCEKEIELMCKPPPRETDGVCRKAPNTEVAAHNVKSTWNKLVVCTFDIITDFPSYVKAAYHKIKSLGDECEDTKPK
ncbi:uncharacterized protein [Onthophagus taurus]|uniref:uncharacterized protein n=1 Tax=Onthophagus taurus TaxID=166361 RepID=UPI000C201D3C|nr:uncharacterized protein LOC111417573 [Onthophagus taurus]